MASIYTLIYPHLRSQQNGNSLVATKLLFDFDKTHEITFLEPELSEKSKIIEIGSLLVILGWFEVWKPAKSFIRPIWNPKGKK